MHLKSSENFALKYIIIAYNFQKIFWGEGYQTQHLTLPPPIPNFWIRRWYQLQRDTIQVYIITACAVATSCCISDVPGAGSTPNRDTAG